MKFSTLILFTLTALLDCKPPENWQFSELPMDSSLVVIAQTSSAFKDSCIPGHWPRVFVAAPEGTVYTAYLFSTTTPYSEREFRNAGFVHSTTDSLSYGLLRYLSMVPVRNIKPSDIGFEHGNRFTIRLISKPFEVLLSRSTDLGYLQISSVVIDTERKTGMYVMSQNGAGYFRQLVQIRFKKGHWHLVRQDIMSIS